MAFTPRQERFIVEYVACGVAKTAAINAGYAEDSAHVTGSRLINDANVAAEIERRKSNITKRVLGKYEVTRERIVEELAKLGFSNMTDYTSIDGDNVVLDFSEVTRDQMAAVKEITSEVSIIGDDENSVQRVRKTKFSLYDKRAALMDLAKLEGHVVDRQQLTGANGGPIAIAAAHVVSAGELNPETRAKLREALEAMGDEE